MSDTEARVLIVDDDEEICEILARLVRAEGYEPLIAHDGRAALEMIRRNAPAVLLLDIKMPGLNGMEVLHEVKRWDRDLPVVMITSHGLAKDAVAALRGGAHDYIVKPFQHADVIRSLHSAMRERGLRRTIQKLSDHSAEAARLREMMGASAAIARVSADAARVACSDFSVLITGESGTGKEIVARAIHQASARAAAPFVSIDCAAVPEPLLESELFGHEKGAFTGATRSKSGRMEIARGGTIYLDEILSIPTGLQAKLLRALQEKSVAAVGGSLLVGIDVRVIAATSGDIDQAAATGSFRRDLYFRLNEFSVAIPPLRERKEDIIFLAKRFLDHTNHELGKTVTGFSEAALERLLRHDWPGNVRELRSMIRRATLLAEHTIEEEHLGLPASATPARPTPLPSDDGLPLRERVRRATAAIERAALIDALRKSNGNKARAARLLQIDYKTLLHKMKEYGIAATLLSDAGES